MLASAQLPEQLDRHLQRIFGEGRLEENRFGPARWLDDGAAYTTVEPSPGHDAAKDLIRYETESGARSVLVSASKLIPEGSDEPLLIEDYDWSPEHDRLLLFTNTRKVWRRNTRGDYWLFELAGGSLRKLGGDAAEASLMFAKFSPLGDRIGFVRGNDIYVEEVEDGSIRRLTTGGSDSLIHGTSDWVYEEELGVRDGFRFSPDGQRIAFWEMDSAGVGTFSLIDNTSELYPQIQEISYPKVGTTNSSVRIGVVPISGDEITYVQLPGDASDTYVARLDWVGSQTLVLQHLNRLQNRNDVLLADATTGVSKRMYRDENEAWLDIVDEHVWIGSGEESELLWLSERSGWRHAYRLRRSGLATPITRFEADVVRVVGVIESETQEGWLYFLASPGDATRLYLYRSPLDGAAPPQRLTPADKPGWHGYDLSPDGKWAFHTTSGFDRPPRVELVRLPEHQIVRTLADNDTLRQEVADLLEAPADFFTVEVEPDVELDAWMLRPDDFDATKRYPLLVYVYGEPAGQTVVDRWSLRRGLFHRALAQNGWVVASFDNRGTPAPKGVAWRKIVYGAIGELSAKDQAAAVRALLREHSYLDPDRVAIWGWSGGGSNTLNAMFRYPEIFKVGVSVAPVPDQRLYDTIYQERYMGLPADNGDGYLRGSPIHFAEGLEGRLLLVHGSGDDNVHYQGTERLVNRLVELGKPFDLMVYPNRSHSISEGDGTSLHLHRLIARYLLETRW